MLSEILDARVQATEPAKVEEVRLLDRLQIWIVVTANDEKERILEALGSIRGGIEVFSIADVSSDLENLYGTGA